MDEAYGCLRDLGVDIKRVKVNVADGSIENVYQHFGEGGGTKVSGFRAVYDNSNSMTNDDMNTRMQEESQAPFASSSHIHSDQCNH